jgi:hypothetical protein
MQGGFTGQEQQASMHPGWEWVIACVLVPLVAVVSTVLSVPLSNLLPRLDPSPGTVAPVLAMWELALLWWAVSVPLAFGSALIVGRMARSQEWGSRLWMRAAMSTPVFCLIAAALFWWLVQEPATAPDSADGIVWGTAWCMAAWGLGIPASVVAGLWLSAGRRSRVVQLVREPRGRT